MKKATKIFILLLVLVTAICCFVGCTNSGNNCEHDWKAATCTKPKTCKLCQATEGAANGHDWTDANCTAPKMCSVCTLAEGSALGHDYDEESCKRCGVSAPAPQEPFTYKLSTDKSSYILFARLNHSDPHLVIPSEYKGLPIMGVQESAFKDCTYLTKVTVPASVQAFGPSAFEGCNNLTTIVFESNETFNSFGSRCFAGCTSLEEIDFPDSLLAIGSDAFSDCTALKNIEFNEGLTQINARAFRNCTLFTKIELPDSLTTLGLGVFSGCYNITEISLPFIGPSIDYDTAYYSSTDYHIGYVFGKQSFDESTTVTLLYQAGTLPHTQELNYYLPTKLNTVVLRGGSIGIGYFRGCTNIYKIVIGENVTRGVSVVSGGIYSTFIECYKLMEVYNLSQFEIDINRLNNLFSNGVNYSLNVANVFTSLTETDNFKVVDNLYVYDDENLSECYVLEYRGDGNTLTLPEYINGKPYHVMPYAFKSNENLNTIKLISPNLVTVGKNAFTTNYQNIYVDKIETWIKGDYSNLLFNYAANLNTTHTEKQLYVNNTLFTKYVIPKDMVEIPEYTFNYIASIKEISAEEGSLLTKISKSAFANSSSLITLSLENCKNLTTIESRAFYNCTNLTNVTINPNLDFTKCATDMFAKCNNIDGNKYKGGIYLGTDANPYKTLIAISDVTLNHLELAPGTECVMNSGDSNYNITSLYVPSSVKYFISTTFNSFWDKLESLYIDDLSSWCNISFNSFTANPMSRAKSLYINGQKVTELFIPSGVEVISDYSLYISCIDTIHIPNTVKKIGTNAFKTVTNLYIDDIVSWLNIEFVSAFSNPMRNSYNEHKYTTLKNVTSLYINNQRITRLEIPAGVTAIPNYAFINLPDSVTEVYIPSSVKSIGKRAFANKDIIIHLEDLASWCRMEIDLYVMGYDGKFAMDTTSHPFTRAKAIYVAGEKLTSIVIPEEITTIKAYTFPHLTTIYSDPALQNVIHSNYIPNLYIPATVKTIESGAFYQSKFDNVYIQDLTSWINITGLKAGDNPAFLTSESKLHLFDQTTNEYVLATEIVIPKEVTEIKPYIFHGWKQLTKLTFEKDSQLKQIGEYAFCNTSITEIVIPASVEIIENNAFYSNTNLISVTFEKDSQLKEIGESAFRYTSITEIVIPASVKIIGQSAFSTDTLISVTFEKNSQLKEIGASAFAQTSITEIVIPASVEIIGRGAFSAGTLVSVIFENTKGWYRETSSTQPGEEPVVETTAMDVSDPAENAKNIKKGTWKRKTEE